MERVPLETDVLAAGHEKTGDIEARVLRSRLVNLTLDWELAALILDAQRYKSHGQIERESLRDCANTYRKCVAELNDAISRSSVHACKAHLAS
jgi:hypothetical protein